MPIRNHGLWGKIESISRKSWPKRCILGIPQLLPWAQPRRMLLNNLHQASASAKSHARWEPALLQAWNGIRLRHQLRRQVRKSKLLISQFFRNNAICPGNLPLKSMVWVELRFISCFSVHQFLPPGQVLAMSSTSSMPQGGCQPSGSYRECKFNIQDDDWTRSLIFAVVLASRPAWRR